MNEWKKAVEISLFTYSLVFWLPDAQSRDSGVLIVLWADAATPAPILWFQTSYYIGFILHFRFNNTESRF